MRPLTKIVEAIDLQRGYLFPWSPVFMGTGIGLYFLLPAEPTLIISVTLILSSPAALGLLLRSPSAWVVPLCGCAIVIFGLGWAAFRTQIVAEPVLTYRYYGPIQGRITGLDRSQSDKIRMTLDRVVLRDTSPERTPYRVRVSIHTKGVDAAPLVGTTVILTGHLSPPQGPAEPGGFDFQRHAWFQKLGGVGYTRTPVLIWDPPANSGLGVAIAKLRHRIADAVRAAVPGDTGGFAAAILTGDRSGIGRETMAELRASNLAHLLAISGLHMGLLTGFVFALLRGVIALVPYVALRVPAKKIAAIGALAAGAFYLALSGGSVATERAFIMVSMMLAAVLMDRRALTLRAVALAALIVLLMRPEALISPGFQMSFAATTALVAAFRALKDWQNNKIPRRLRPVLGLLLSSAVAGAATAPIGAAHFNQIAHFGLLANTASVPLMGSLVIPAAVLAAILAPFGLEWIGLALMALGVRWILGVADWIAGLDGAISHVSTPPTIVLPLIGLGILTVFLWQGRARAAGVVIAIAGGVSWSQNDRPHLLISGTGGLVGVMGDEGRVISKERGEGFVANNWLENDGDPVLQKVAADRGGFEGSRTLRFGQFDELKIAHLTGKKAALELHEACKTHDIVVTNIAAKIAGCDLYDVDRLRELGALALYPTPKGLALVSARSQAGRRPWNSRQRQ